MTEEDKLFHCVLAFLVVLILSVVGIGFWHNHYLDHRDVGAASYQEVKKWIGEYPELGDTFKEFTWEDNKLQIWEYDAINVKHTELIDLNAFKSIQDSLEE